MIFPGTEVRPSDLGLSSHSLSGASLVLSPLPLQVLLQMKLYSKKNDWYLVKISQI